MRYCSGLLLLSLLLPAYFLPAYFLPANAKEQAKLVHLEAEATCRDNARCEVVDDRPLLLDVRVTNQKNENLECAFIFVEKMGPPTVLVNKLTGRTTTLPLSLGPRHSEIRMTTLRPGESWTTYVLIDARTIQKLGPGDAGVEARIAVTAEGRYAETGEPILCTGTATLQIGARQG